MAVRNDPEELIRFANFLQNYLETLEEKTNVLCSEFQRVHDVWDDAKYAEFEDVLGEMKSQIHSFCDKSQEQIPHLHAMSDKLREYLEM